jgi:glycosyltransferase involved in cell wall biosynthesis
MIQPHTQHKLLGTGCPNCPTLSIVIPTIGRPTLGNTLASLRGQLHPGDEVIVQFDATSSAGWDHGDRKDYSRAGIARDIGAARAKGTHLMFIDDDDAYLPGALDEVRAEITKNPRSLLIFQTLFNRGERVRWEVPEFAGGQCPTPSVVVPRLMAPLWEPIGDHVHQDLEFAKQCAQGTFPNVPVWIAQPIAIARPVPDDNPYVRADVWINNQRRKR